MCWSAKKKLQKPICSSSHTASSQPSPECAEQHDHKSSPCIFQASTDLGVMGRDLATAMVSPALTEGSTSQWQVALSHAPCAGTVQPLHNLLALTITHRLCDISSPFRLFSKSWVHGTSSPSGPQVLQNPVGRFPVENVLQEQLQILLSYFTVVLHVPHSLSITADNMTS